VDARQRGFRRTLCPAPTVIRKDAGVGLKASQETLARRAALSDAAENNLAGRAPPIEVDRALNGLLERIGAH
jgi:hypothetical protein